MIEKEELKISTALKTYDYNRETKVLSIEFTKGNTIYHYQNVQLKTWVHFLRHCSVSSGQAYHLFIKDRFEFSKEAVRQPPKLTLIKS